MAKESLKVVSSDPVEIPDDTEEVPLHEVTDVKVKPVEKEAKEEDEDDAPPQPARPVNQLSRVTNDLKDAFPDIEDKIIKAVLIASQGAIDPAFNALLYLSDPKFEAEVPEPVPRRQGSHIGDKYGGLTDDELLARKLQKEFELEDERVRSKGSKRSGKSRSSRTVAPQEQDSPDEFEQLKETFTQGLEEARTTLNGWVSGLAKKLDGEPDDPKRDTKLFGALGGSSYNNRKTRFDEDPEIINQNEFGKKIVLNEKPSNAVDLVNLESKPVVPEKEASIAGAPGVAPVGKKWQPLNSDVPANSDAFLVTDSEDEDK